MKPKNDVSWLISSEILDVRSPAFRAQKFIPPRYTCDGSNVNPAIWIETIPEGTQSFAIILEDPDVPAGLGVHWLVWNLPVVQQIAENTQEGEVGTNDFGSPTYNGPCPLLDIHRYVFEVYALDTRLSLPAAASKPELLEAMQEHIIGFGELACVYQRNIWLSRHK